MVKSQLYFFPVMMFLTKICFYWGFGFFQLIKLKLYTYDGNEFFIMFCSIFSFVAF